MVKKQNRFLSGYNTASSMIARVGVEEARRQHEKNTELSDDQFEDGFVTRLKEVESAIEMQKARSSN